MEEALNFFLDNEQVHASSTAPDEAIDYIFMLEEKDLEILADEWDQRDDEWREALVYLIGNLELSDNQHLMFKGLIDPNPDVLEQTLLSLHQSITESQNDDQLIPDELKRAALIGLEKVEMKYPELPELKELLNK